MTGKQAIYIVVAIVGEDESAMANVFFKVLALFAGKLHEFMSAQITNGQRKISSLLSGTMFSVVVNRQSGVFDKRVQILTASADPTSQSPTRTEGG